MNAEKKGFKYRLSNVLAWLGFGIRYDYSGADGVEITQLTIPADTCQ